MTAEVKTRPEIVVPIEFRAAPVTTTAPSVEAAVVGEQDWSGVAEITTGAPSASTVEVDWAQVNESSSPGLSALVVPEAAGVPLGEEPTGVPLGEEPAGVPLGEEPPDEEQWAAVAPGEQQWSGEEAANTDQAVGGNSVDGLESMAENVDPAQQQGWVEQQPMGAEAEAPQQGLSAEDPVWGQSQSEQGDFPPPDVTPSWDTQGMGGVTAEVAAVAGPAQVDIDVPDDVHGALTRRGVAAVSRSAPEAAESIDPGFQQMHVPRLNDLGPSLDWNKADMAGPFHLGNDGLALRVEGELFARLTGLVAVVGRVDVAPENKRARGRATEWAFGEEDQQMHRCKGHGVVYLDAGTANFQALELDEDGAYIREERVFAFEESVGFENGRLTADNNLWLDLVHLKGQGRVLMKLFGQMKAMNIPAGRPLMVPLARVVGWYGAVTPRLIAFGGQGAIELVGEGYALLATPG